MIICLLLFQTWTTYLDLSLKYIGLTQVDITFRSDYTVRDVYRFAVVDHLLQRPIETVDFLQTTAGSFKQKSDREMIQELSTFYGITLEEPSQVSLDKVCTESAESLNDIFAHAPLDLQEVYQELIRFSPDLSQSIEESREKEQRSDSLVQYLKDHAQSIDYQRLFQVAADVLNAALQYDQWLNSIPLDSSFIVQGIDGEVMYYAHYKWGDMVVGGRGKNVYTKDVAVIIDLGGDDEYLFTDPCPLSIIIDRSGDDTYTGKDKSIGTGFWGISILIDKLGDDTYEAGSFSIGCGVFGVGVLIDRSGSDTYIGDTFTQGVGGFGIGIIKDYEGNDKYEGALYAQGFASTYGIGVLDDRAGNDMYYIIKKYTDEIRYLDHYLSLSQGFSMGFRPDLSAGIGLIFETEGNDVYIGDIFAQGSSYWYGIGGIVDQAGNDDYIAYQYAQGAGTHITIGALIDEAGNDSYVSKGVSQGCGHDLSFGMLYDINGNDHYVAFDLSQGAGNANGIGVLMDAAGDDSYSVIRSHNTQGYGNWRREYGSIGVLIDVLGDDDYRDGENHCIWKNGAYGVGVDLE